MSYTAIRTLSFSVTPSALSPSGPVAAGVQGEHNATRVIFSLDTALQQENFRYRFEYEDGAGGFDSTGEVALSDGKVSCFLPRAWTENGGMATLRLVMARVGTDGDEQTVYSFAARLKFAGRRWEETGGLPAEKPLLSSLLAQTAAVVQAAQQVGQKLEQAEQAVAKKASRPATVTAGHLAGLDKDGNLTDSGVAVGAVVTDTCIAAAGRSGLVLLGGNVEADSQTGALTVKPATAGTAGVVKPDMNSGFFADSDGTLGVLGMSESEIQYRNDTNRHPIPLNALDTAVKQALTNSKTVVYSDNDKEAARTLLGCAAKPASFTAGHLAVLNGDGEPADSGVDCSEIVKSTRIATAGQPGLVRSSGLVQVTDEGYMSVPYAAAGQPGLVLLGGNVEADSQTGALTVKPAAAGTAGVVKPDMNSGFFADSDGTLGVLGMSESEIQYRNDTNRHPIPLSALDTAVKQALTNSKTVVYSDSDKRAAQALLGGVVRPTVNTDASGMIQLIDNVIYRRGTLSEVKVLSPDLVSPEQCCELVFVSGATAATFAVETGRLVMRGDDCTGGTFTPQPNRRYDILFSCDGANNYGVVLGTEVNV